MQNLTISNNYFFSLGDIAHQTLLIDGYVVPIVSALGIVFAIIGICDLLQKKNRQSFFNLLLASLLAFDFILLLSYLINSIVIYFVAIPIEYFSFYPIVVCSSLRFSLTGVIFMTVALSYSRSKAVEKPFEARINAMESDSEKLFRFLPGLRTLVLRLESIQFH